VGWDDTYREDQKFVTAEKRPRKRPSRAAGQRSARLHNGLSIIPNLFTVGNIFCGYFAVISTLRGNYDSAAIAIGVGAVLDALDGRIARLTKTTSDFGVQLDSLADVISFGVAPAMLAFQWGLSSLQGMEANIAKHVTQFGWFATFAFVICGTLRLARFNIQTSKPETTPGSKRNFVGLPIPAGAGVVAAFVHFFKSPVLQVGSALLWCLLVLLAAILMISTVRYPSFKSVDLRKSRPRFVFLAAGLGIAFVSFYSEIALMILAVVYISSGPVLKLIHVVHRLMPAAGERVRPSEPAHGNIDS
jgi:CDP-diacylglycerol---serine O-phosphatidyltransferase